MKPHILFLCLTFASLISCQNLVQKQSSIENVESNNISKSETNQYKSLIRPNEKLELQKIYMDTVTYEEFNDGGDHSLIFIKTSSNEESLICDWSKTYDYVKGEKVIIQWKLDSIRYAGDPEFLDYKEFLVSIQKLNEK